MVIDPHMDNERAVRAYEKCGFRKVKPLREHELQDGEWHDCWLMEVRNLSKLKRLKRPTPKL